MTVVQILHDRHANAVGFARCGRRRNASMRSFAFIPFLVLESVGSVLIEGRRMHYRHLYYFVRIVEAGSFSQAARTIHVAQPALSQQIGELEASLGVSLLQRKIGRAHV